MKRRLNLRGFSAYRLWSQLPSLEVSHLPDVIMFAAAIALFYGVLVVGRSWFGPFRPAVEISRSVWALPAYAGYSLLRIAIAYFLSLAFTLVYGYAAAYHPRAERFMIPLLDVLQSIPVLSFLPGVMLAMVALFPGRQLGVEFGAILLIFTGEVWNMAFSFCVIAKLSSGDARGRRYLSLQLVAALLADGAAVFGDRAGLELDDVGGGRLVRPDGLRNVRPGTERFSIARARLLSANRGERGRYCLDRMGCRHDGRGNCVARSIYLAAGDRMGGEVQGRASGECGRSAIVGIDPGRALARIRAAAGKNIDSAEREECCISRGSTARKMWRKQHRRGDCGWCGRLRAGALAIGYGIVRVAIVLAGLQRPELREAAIGLGATFLRVNVALLIGTLWTVPAGVAIGFSPRLARIAQPLAQIAASVPATALLPVILLLLIRVGGGLGIASIVVLLLGTQWYVLFNVIAAQWRFRGSEGMLCRVSIARN